MSFSTLLLPSAGPGTDMSGQYGTVYILRERFICYENISSLISDVFVTDYSQIGAPIRVSFFDDRIEMENPGILLPGMTIEDVRSGVSKIRIRVIARVFRELDLIEQWGSGFRRILQEAADLGLSEPVIEEIGMRVRVTVFLAESQEIHVPEQVIRLLHCLEDTPLSVKRSDEMYWFEPSSFVHLRLSETCH